MPVCGRHRPPQAANVAAAASTQNSRRHSLIGNNPQISPGGPTCVSRHRNTLFRCSPSPQDLPSSPEYEEDIRRSKATPQPPFVTGRLTTPPPQPSVLRPSG
ncbi:hypothetical protein PLESTF_000700400 [Pleodorina starrii]|nr:hypothetical protein PLESTF_000700400 [Pleodorina starrii]